MRTINIRYGRGSFELKVPDSAPVQEFGIAGVDSAASPEEALKQALDGIHPEVQPLATGRHVGLLIDDATRREPHEQALSACLRFLGEVQASSVSIFVCTGTHDPHLKENQLLLQALGKVVQGSAFPQAPLYMHDCDGHMVSKGKTSRGTPLLVNSASEYVDVFLAISDMKNHYFAGYSNPVKGFLPGICGFASARGNHSLALDPASTFGCHPWHPDPTRRQNPLAEDMVEAMHLILHGRPAFAVCMFTSSSQVIWAGAGEVAEVSARGMLVVDEATSCTVEPAARVIVTAGGHPYDESIYNAQRALELTRNAVRPAAQILFFADCENGIGPDKAIAGFYDRLRPPLAEVLESFEGEYEMYSHKTYKFAKLLEFVEEIALVSRLEAKVLEDIHLSKEADPQARVDRWLQEDPDAPILVFHDASKLAVYQGSPSNPEVQRTS